MDCAAAMTSGSPVRPAVPKSRALNWARMWSSVSLKCQPLEWAFSLTRVRWKALRASWVCGCVLLWLYRVVDYCGSLFHVPTADGTKVYSPLGPRIPKLPG